MSLSPEQLAARLEGISATDVAAIVRCHPYSEPIDIFLAKTGQAPPRNENAPSKWGHLLEPVIRDDYEQRMRVRVEVPGTLRRRDRPWWMASPDGLVYPIGSATVDRGLEIKVHNADVIRFSALEYGAPGSDEVPLHELIQCQWGMGATGLERWDLVAFLGGSPVDYAIMRDDELIEMLAEAAERFLVDHIRTGTPPDPDGSKSWDEWLKRRWKYKASDLVDVGDRPELLALIDELRDASEAEVLAEKRVASLIQRVKLEIGDGTGITWKGERPKPDKITWKQSKTWYRTDWKPVAADMQRTAALTVSGTQSAVDRALICLRSALGSGQIGSSTQAAISGSELATILVQLRESLLEIAQERTKPQHTTEVSSRPFLRPRHWKTVKKPDEEKQA